MAEAANARFARWNQTIKSKTSPFFRYEGQPRESKAAALHCPSWLQSSCISIICGAPQALHENLWPMAQAVMNLQVILKQITPLNIIAMTFLNLLFLNYSYNESFLKIF